MIISGWVSIYMVLYAFWGIAVEKSDGNTQNCVCVGGGGVVYLRCCFFCLFFWLVQGLETYIKLKFDIQLLHEKGILGLYWRQRKKSVDKTSSLAGFLSPLWSVTVEKGWWKREKIIFAKSFCTWSFLFVFFFCLMQKSKGAKREIETLLPIELLRLRTLSCLRWWHLSGFPIKRSNLAGSNNASRTERSITVCLTECHPCRPLPMLSTSQTVVFWGNDLFSFWFATTSSFIHSMTVMFCYIGNTANVTGQN